jgi:hypothetical protein
MPFNLHGNSDVNPDEWLVDDVLGHQIVRDANGEYRLQFRLRWGGIDERTGAPYPLEWVPLNLIDGGPVMDAYLSSPAWLNFTTSRQYTAFLNRHPERCPILPYWPPDVEEVVMEDVFVPAHKDEAWSDIKSSAPEGDDKCPICHEDYTGATRVVMFECSHHVCAANCYPSFIQKCKECLICRKEIRQ